MIHTERNELIVMSFLSDKGFREIVEYDCGTPVHVVVNWDSGFIRVIGPEMGKDIPIKSILDAAGPHWTQ